MSAPKLELQKLLVFSDLDGTLLDHHTYSFEAAKPSLAFLKGHQIPVILNTSKTAEEVIQLRDEIGLSSPFIIENGAAILIPKNSFAKKPKGTVWQGGYWVKAFASKRSHWLSLIEKLSEKYEGMFEGFSSMSLTRICEVTGLDENKAKSASKRFYGEPLLWKGSDEARSAFIQDAKKMGASPLLGGRFLHICGDTNKGKALLWLKQEYERQNNISPMATIALGDGNNDVAMLEAADIAIRIKSPVNPPPELSGGNLVITSTLNGPQGWHESLSQVLKYNN